MPPAVPAGAKASAGNGDRIRGFARPGGPVRIACQGEACVTTLLTWNVTGLEVTILWARSRTGFSDSGAGREPEPGRPITGCNDDEQRALAERERP